MLQKTAPIIAANLRFHFSPVDRMVVVDAICAVLGSVICLTLCMKVSLKIMLQKTLSV